jgi:16S rRNA (uracil1498-N3)-methyltransferase
MTAAAHVFVDDLDAPALADADRHHIERVLRLRPGEIVTVSDGAGGWRSTVLRPGLALEPAGEVERPPRPAPSITVGFALVKGERPDWIVQKLTECGVDRVVPFTAARSIVKWDAAKAVRHVERWRAIAREAAMQSRRLWLPDVDDVTGFEDALTAVRGSIADAGGEPPRLDGADPGGQGVLVGPEGGWTDDERRMATRRVALGAHVYRAETAAVAAGVLLGALRSGVVTAPP